MPRINLHVGQMPSVCPMEADRGFAAASIILRIEARV